MSTPFRDIALGPYEGRAEQRPDGSWLLHNTQPLGPYPQRLTERLVHWATTTPDQPLFAKRDAQGAWQHLTFAQALEGARRIGQSLLDRGLSTERPLMILSGNDLEHAQLALAALHVGVPFMAVSPAYSLLSPDAARVAHAVQLLTPGLVYASDAAAFRRAIDIAVPQGTELAFGQGSIEGRPCTTFEALRAREATPAVDAAHAAVGPDSVAKFLFTSGSTKLPKAVVNTQRMLCSNQVAHWQCYPFVTEEKPVLVDWLPWHHTAAGNNNFGLVVFHGGTLYIDEGKPTPDGIGQTLRNLREVSPTIYYTVPKGLESLVAAMRQDVPLRERFFARVRLIFPAGAALPPPLKAELEAMAVQTVGARIPMTMGLGMTETAPFAISAHLPDWRPGLIGLPAPGTTVKLVPSGDKLEVRYRGPNITPGYWRQPDLTAEAFDDEGFFCSGDAARFIDEARPEQGLFFDGRIAEDFKLISGTWVNVGALRNQVIAAGAPYVQDVVLTGHDRDALGMLVFLLPSAADLCRDPAAAASLPTLCDDPGVVEWAQRLLDEQAARGTGSSNRIVRAMLLREPASVGLGEMTDKGSINQRAVLKARAALVDRLYADPVQPPVLVARPG
jgi:feruloyl-CoA synthase